ncbi:hypothetical protein AGMMS50262_19110 [Bacteroidia bacterium]|nr:hypothetical protein AGMMS50262_19110 [Bacteroidia bacterium]
MEIAKIKENSEQLLFGIEQLIEQTGRQVAVYLNTTISRLYWSIGNYIIADMQHEAHSQYGQQIVATLSQQLMEKFGKGYSYTAITRMIKVAEAYPEEMFATVSQTLSWSHFIELISIEDSTKRLFYQQMSIVENWSVRTLRQKRIPIDSVDYSFDLLFFHRKLNRLIAIDLKLGKFQPKYKGQMELYLKYLQKHDRQPHENSPVGLLLCSEGNTEHIELLMLDEKNIKVAQYLTALPDKQWFIDKLNRSIAIAQQNVKLADEKELAREELIIKKTKNN